MSEYPRNGYLLSEDLVSGDLMQEYPMGGHLDTTNMHLRRVSGHLMHEDTMGRHLIQEDPMSGYWLMRMDPVSGHLVQEYPMDT